MSSRVRIELPDPVIIWEVEYDIDPARWTASATVGDVTIFERTYCEAGWHNYEASQADQFAETADEARVMAARELGEKLKGLLS